MQEIVDALAEKLDARLREWKPEAAAQARERIAEVIELTWLRLRPTRCIGFSQRVGEFGQAFLASLLYYMRHENDGRFGSGGQIHSVAAQSVAVYAATTCIGSRRIGTSPLKATAARGSSSR